MDKDIWQFETLEQLKDLLKSFNAVQAAILVGSMANDAIQPDFWSDIDLVIIIEDEAIQHFYPDTDWLKPINSIYATSYFEAPYRFTSRICFTDMRRLDLIFVSASAFADRNCWDYNPFQNGYHILFSKLPTIEKSFSDGFPNPLLQSDQDAQFLALNDAFWFKGMLVVYKVVRNDLLIALHLTLDLMRDCLVLKMMLRDREQGTNHHRIGGVGNNFVEQMNTQPLEFSAIGILEIVENSSRTFDALGEEWSSDYSEKCFPLQGWINNARENLIIMDAPIRS